MFLFFPVHFLKGLTDFSKTSLTSTNDEAQCNLHDHTFRCICILGPRRRSDFRTRETPAPQARLRSSALSKSGNRKRGLCSRFPDLQRSRHDTWLLYQRRRLEVKSARTRASPEGRWLGAGLDFSSGSLTFGDFGCAMGEGRLAAPSLRLAGLLS